MILYMIQLSRMNMYYTFL